MNAPSRTAPSVRSSGSKVESAKREGDGERVYTLAK
jgi:hypothetical protein